ncbi:MAG TPA: PIN domain-containing protein [Nitrososphaerales archaeon]
MGRTVDTRFFLTIFLADNDELKQKVKVKIAELRRESAIVPTIVIHEVYKFIYQKIGREAADIEVKAIESSGFKIINLDVNIAKTAAILRCKYHNLPTADAVIAATSIEQKSNAVVSDDEHFSKMKEIKTEWI